MAFQSITMTEDEWLISTDSWKMLHIIQGTGPSERKVRLFNAAVCRRYWDYLPAESQVILVESERLADGLIPRPSNELELCRRANSVVAPFDRQYPTKQFPSAEIRIRRDAAAAVCYAVIPNEMWGAVGYFWDIDPAEKELHSVIIRDVFGNPFHPAVKTRAWRTPKVEDLAQEIYDERAFGRMSELAAAIEEAGCNDADVLNHCRSPGQHALGCWVMDILLGKK